MSQPEIITFGCRLNAFESEVMREHAAGLNDTVIVNTCAVTSEAERQARQAIRRARRTSPNARIIVTGCAAQINAESFAAMPEVDQVMGNAEKLLAESFKANDSPILVGDIMAARETAAHLITGFHARSRAFVQIQNGCDHRCTFCAIPYGRGPSRSVPMGQIVDQARKLVATGIREIVLTGVDITAYGSDLPGDPGLGSVVRRLLRAVPDVKRLRLSSLDVAEIDGDLRDLLATEARLMPHLHLSLQSGDDLVLKRMKRRHTRIQAIAFCEELRASRSDVVFGADLIAGFPTEDVRMFQRTLDLVDEAGLTFLHVFPYSSRQERLQLVCRRCPAKFAGNGPNAFAQSGWSECALSSRAKSVARRKYWWNARTLGEVSITRRFTWFQMRLQEASSVRFFLPSIKTGSWVGACDVKAGRRELLRLVRSPQARLGAYVELV